MEQYAGRYRPKGLTKAEAKEQFINGVLESDDYYNSWIMVRVRKSHIKGLQC